MRLRVGGAARATALTLLTLYFAGIGAEVLFASERAEGSGVATRRATRRSPPLLSQALPSAAIPIQCGDATGDGNITASDALAALSSAVGVTACRACVCDVDTSGTITASDALALLKVAVGHSITLDCAPCSTTTTTTPTTTTLPPSAVNHAPGVILTATPAVGLTPLEVSFATTAYDFEGDPLTYSWDFGDGTVRGGGVIETHVYTTPGSYRVVVTVSDDNGSGVDRVVVDAGTALASEEIDAAGGDITVGRFSLNVPAGTVTEPVRFEVTEVPSQAAAAAADLDPAAFQPIGPAYRLQSSFLSRVALGATISYEEGEIPAGFAASDLAVMLRLQPETEETAGLPRVSFSAVPAQPDVAARTVAFDLYSGGIFQLVAVNQPEPTEAAARATRTSRRGHAIGEPAADVELPAFAVHFWAWPADHMGMRSDALDALQMAASKYMSWGLEPPPWTSVIVGKLHKDLKPAFVDAKFPLAIFVDVDSYPSADTALGTKAFSNIVFHEYFHVVQFWNTNPQSVNDLNRWFFEGTADWASDEVIDHFSSAYHAPTGRRFLEPLNLPVPVGDARAYQTVVFWKWFEEKGGGSIADLINHHRWMTQSEVNNVFEYKPNAALALASLRELNSGLDFLAFAKSALYLKDFDTNETEPGDLWHPSNLGPPGELPEYFADPAKRVSLSPDFDSVEPYDEEHPLVSHLNAHAVVIESEESDPVAGTLNLRFNRPVGIDVDAVVIPPCSPEKTVRDIEKMPGGTTVTVPFGTTDEVILIVASTRLADPTVFGKFVTDAWVDGAGTTAAVHEVACCSIEDVRNALYAARPGDTVRLAPGRYYAAGKLWNDPRLGMEDFPASLIVWPGVTLAGSRDERSRNWSQVVPTDDHPVVALDGSALRDLWVRVGEYQGTVAWGAHSLSLCNVEIGGSMYADNFAGLDFVVRDEKPATLDVFDSVIFCTQGCKPSFVSGIRIRNDGAGSTPGSVLVKIDETKVTGWFIGLEYSFGDPPAPVTLDVDCSGFTDNNYNVAIWDTGWIDQCPAPASFGR